MADTGHVKNHAALDLTPEQLLELANSTANIREAIRELEFK